MCCQTFLPHSYMLAASGVSLNGTSSKRPSLTILPKVGQSVPVSAQINQSAFQKSFPLTPNLPDAVLMFLIIG